MKILIFIGSGLLLVSSLLFYAERRREDGQNDASLQAVEKVLQAESQSLGGRIEEVALKADRDALNGLVHWRKKAKMRSFLSDTTLSEPDAPKWMIVGGRRIRAAGLLDNPLLEDALESRLEKGDRFSLYSSKGKYYLFVRGTLVDGQPYVSAYSPEALFSSFQSGDGLRVWLANQDGTVLFHPLQRFIGSNVANLRPVAAAIQRLAEGKTAHFTQRYLGLEGKEALGSWAVLPVHNLLVASEWPREPDTSTRYGAFFWIALGVGGIGMVVVGMALGFRSSETGTPSERVFDLGRLDEDALEYLEQAKASAERAVEFAKDQEAFAEQARRERARLLAQARHLERKIQQLEAFQERILPQLTGKQVWNELGKLLFESAPGLTVVVYRYAPSTFSLVPEAVFDGAALAANAIAYLKDARVFVGKTSFLPTLLQTQAFAKWNTTRERHMPLQHTEFRVFPFAGQGGRGVILALFDRRINEAGELEDAFLLSEQLIRRAGTFCDSLTPLIQSMYAKGYAGSSLAGAPNDPRNRPRST